MKRMATACAGWAVAIAAAAAPAGESWRPGPVLRKALAGPLAGAEEVVFAVRAPGQDPHWYANFGYWCSEPRRMMYGGGGARLCRLNLRTGKLTVLVDDPAGSVRDPAVHYDGRTVLFSYRPGGEKHYHLFRLDAFDGGLVRITKGDFDDIEPCWLPVQTGSEAAGGGPREDIVFCSSRCNRWVNCWHTQVAILYRSRADGTGARPISSNIEHDNTPAVLPDGRVLYTRWEYVDRSQVDFHHLWTVNPDGTGQMAFFGNMHRSQLFIDAVPLPDRPRAVAAIFCPGHGRREHVGDLHIIAPDAGPDERSWARPVPGCPRFVRDPQPYGEGWFLVARGRQLVLVDSRAGASEVVYTLPEPLRRRGLEVHEPRALRPRRRETVLAERSDAGQATGRFVLADVTAGRRMDGVRPGEIKKLLVLESLPKPVNFSGGPEPVSYLGTFTLERVLGTVPVEPDGSAYFEAPANRPVFFVALDGNDLSVKRMHSFTSVMPGEAAGCVGCHERRTTAAPAGRALAAVRRGPSRIEPLAGLPDVPDFPRDIQPILDRHCVRCHNYRKRSGRVLLTGARGPRYSHAYWSLLAWGQVADGRNSLGNTAPRSVGSAASGLMRKVGGPVGTPTRTHHDVQLTQRERRMVWLWLEAAAPYAGTYASLGTGQADIGYWGGADNVLARRCGGCHCPPREDGRHPPEKLPLPAAHHPRRPGMPAHERWVGTYLPAATRSSHILANFTTPADSPLLLAPLAKEAGGWAVTKRDPRRRDGRHPVVFRSKDDRDYQALLERIRRAKRWLDRVKRFDMPGFRPNAHYIREMKRYGILPASFDPARDAIDVYQTDRAYWRSFWYTPGR